LDPRQLDIERMPLLQISRKWFSPERFRKPLTRAAEFSFRRCPGFLRDILNVDLVHGLQTLKDTLTLALSQWARNSLLRRSDLTGNVMRFWFLLPEGEG